VFILIGKIETLVLLFERGREKMGDKNDGLGLSLSLGYATQRNHHQQPSLKLNLMPSASQNKHKKTSWTDLFQSPGTCFVSSCFWALKKQAFSTVFDSDLCFGLITGFPLLFLLLQIEHVIRGCFNEGLT